MVDLAGEQPVSTLSEEEITFGKPVFKCVGSGGFGLGCVDYFGAVGCALVGTAGAGVDGFCGCVDQVELGGEVVKTEKGSGGFDGDEVGAIE